MTEIALPASGVPEPVASGPRPDPARADRTQLILLELEGSQPGAVFSLRGSSSIIGRSRKADVRLADTGVSSQHARITAGRSGVQLEDLASEAGTFVNGQRIHERTRLADGDYLRLGDGRTVLKFSMVDELEERAHRMLFELTLRDPLTRLYNRRYFDDRLSCEFAFAQRHHTELGVLLIDIDHFKRFNDNCGHQLGDVVLRLVASSVQRMMRPEDVLARYGGDELVILARATSARNMEILGERVCHHTASLPLDLPKRDLELTVSIGVSYMSRDLPGSSSEALLRAADLSLLEAKATGRNRVVTAAARR